jgi:two-component system response regulator NreC
MAQKLVSDYLSLIEGDEGFRKLLSPREKEIIKLIAKGYTSSEIAKKLVLSQSTIHSHRSNLMKKLGLDSRHELIKYALERGLLH